MVYIKSMFILFLLLLSQSECSIKFPNPKDLLCTDIVYQCARKFFPKTLTKATTIKRVREIINSNRNSQYEAVKKCICAINCNNIFSYICN